VDSNPLFDETGAAIANAQSGHVWFLAGVINVSGTAVRSGTIPTGKALFFPIINFEADNLCPPIVPPLDVAGLRALASASIAGATLEADVDGRVIQNPQQYHETSPVFSVTFPNNNVFQFFGCNVPAGTYSLPDGFVDEGYYLMLAPLSAGQHTIHFHGTVPSANFILDITYHLTVVGGPPAPPAPHGRGLATADEADAVPTVPAPFTIASGALAEAPVLAQTHLAAAFDQVIAGSVASSLVGAPGKAADAAVAPHLVSAEPHGGTALDLGGWRELCTLATTGSAPAW
jgi:hypothetical protein